jgi:hypothetical protein
MYSACYICVTNSTSGGLKPIKDLWSDEKYEYEYEYEYEQSPYSF